MHLIGNSVSGERYRTTMVLLLYAPATKWGGAYSFTLVRTYVRLSHFLVLFLSPQLLLKYLMQGLETGNTVQTCIGHVHKGNRILIQIIIAELHPLVWLTYFGPYHTVVLFLSLHLLQQYLMQGFEACNTVQTYIEHMHKGNIVLIQDIIAELCLPEWDTYFDHITVWFSLYLRNSYSIWCRDLKLATHFRHAFGICIEETEFWSRS